MNTLGFRGGINAFGLRHRIATGWRAVAHFALRVRRTVGEGLER
jgi:hypothetical protein